MMERALLVGVFIMTALILGIEVAWVIVMQMMGEMM